MKKKTIAIVAIALALCVILAAGTAFAAPHRGGGESGFSQNRQDTEATPQQTFPRNEQCTYPDCPRGTDGTGVCMNENCPYFQDCPNEDCPRRTGGTCVNPDCPFEGERPQDGTGNQAGKNENRNNSANNGTGNNNRTGGGHRGNGHHGGRHH